MAPRKRLGALLIEMGVIDEHQLNSALGHQRQWGGKLGSVLVQKGLCKEADVVRVLSVHLGMPIIHLSEVRADPRALKMVTRQVAEKLRVFPVEVQGVGRTEVLTIAMAEPSDLSVVDQIAFHTGKRVKPVLTGESEIATAIALYYGDAAGQSSKGVAPASGRFPAGSSTGVARPAAVSQRPAPPPVAPPVMAPAPRSENATNTMPFGRAAADALRTQPGGTASSGALAGSRPSSMSQYAPPASSPYAPPASSPYAPPGASPLPVGPRETPSSSGIYPPAASAPYKPSPSGSSLYGAPAAAFRTMPGYYAPPVAPAPAIPSAPAPLPAAPAPAPLAEIQATDLDTIPGLSASMRIADTMPGAAPAASEPVGWDQAPGGDPSPATNWDDTPAEPSALAMGVPKQAATAAPDELPAWGEQDVAFTEPPPRGDATAKGQEPARSETAAPTGDGPTSSGFDRPPVAQRELGGFVETPFGAPGSWNNSSEGLSELDGSGAANDPRTSTAEGKADELPADAVFGTADALGGESAPAADAPIDAASFLSASSDSSSFLEAPGASAQAHSAEHASDEIDALVHQQSESPAASDEPDESGPRPPLHDPWADLAIPEANPGDAARDPGQAAKAAHEAWVADQVGSQAFTETLETQVPPSASQAEAAGSVEEKQPPAVEATVTASSAQPIAVSNIPWPTPAEALAAVPGTVQLHSSPGMLPSASDPGAIVAPAAWGEVADPLAAPHDATPAAHDPGSGAGASAPARDEAHAVSAADEAPSPAASAAAADDDYASIDRASGPADPGLSTSGSGPAAQETAPAEHAAAASEPAPAPDEAPIAAASEVAHQQSPAGLYAESALDEPAPAATADLPPASDELAPQHPSPELAELSSGTAPLSASDIETLAGVGIDPADGKGALRLLAGLLRALAAKQVIDLGELTVDLYAQRLAVDAADGGTDV